MVELRKSYGRLRFLSISDPHLPACASTTSIRTRGAFPTAPLSIPRRQRLTLLICDKPGVHTLNNQNATSSSICPIVHRHHQALCSRTSAYYQHLGAETCIMLRVCIIKIVSLYSQLFDLGVAFHSVRIITTCNLSHHM